MQETTLNALRVLLTSCLDHAFDIALVPGLDEGYLDTMGHHLFSGMLPQLRFASGSRPPRETVMLAGVLETFQSPAEARDIRYIAML